VGGPSRGLPALTHVPSTFPQNGVDLRFGDAHTQLPSGGTLRRGSTDWLITKGFEPSPLIDDKQLRPPNSVPRSSLLEDDSTCPDSETASIPLSSRSTYWSSSVDTTLPLDDRGLVEEG
jgi:hypothetical protein